MRKLEEAAWRRYSIPTVLLMENAGRSVADAVGQHLRPKRRSALIVCGQGNNGGDGFCAARHLHNRGFRTQTVFIGKPQGLKPDSALNFEIFCRMGLPWKRFEGLSDGAFRRMLRGAGVIIDAMFGTGLSREVGGPYARAIKLINEHTRGAKSASGVLAVDIPSGLNADSGKVMGCAVRAGFTVTFGCHKRGMKGTGARRSCGKIILGDITLPRELI